MRTVAGLLAPTARTLRPSLSRRSKAAKTPETSILPWASANSPGKRSVSVTGLKARAEPESMSILLTLTVLPLSCQRSPVSSSSRSFDNVASIPVTGLRLPISTVTSWVAYPSSSKLTVARVLVSTGAVMEKFPSLSVAPLACSVLSTLPLASMSLLTVTVIPLAATGWERAAHRHWPAWRAH